MGHVGSARSTGEAKRAKQALMRVTSVVLFMARLVGLGAQSAKALGYEHFKGKYASRIVHHAGVMQPRGKCGIARRASRISQHNPGWDLYVTETGGSLKISSKFGYISHITHESQPHN